MTYPLPGIEISAPVGAVVTITTGTLSSTATCYADPYAITPVSLPLTVASSPTTVYVATGKYTVSGYNLNATIILEGSEVATVGGGQFPAVAFPNNLSLAGEVDATGVSPADSTINSAATAFGNASGTLWLPPNPNGGQASFGCNNALTLGNGTSSTASSVNGVTLMGMGAPGLGLTNQTPPTRIFANQSLSQLIVVSGPTFGHGLKNLYLDPNGHMTSGTMLTVTSGQVGTFENLLIKVPGGGTAINETVSGGAVANQNTMHNTWRKIYITYANANTSTSWIFNGAATTSNTCYEDISDVYFQWANASSGQTMTLMQFSSCDNIRMRNIHCNGIVTPSGTNRAILFDYSVAGSNQWPADCLIDGIDFGGTAVTIANSGTAPGAGAKPNRIVALSATNGQPSNPTLTNLDFGYSNSSP